MEQLDLVITVDTAAAHLAGALGKPALVLLRYVTDWRWLDERADSPWYPTIKLFRQAHPDDFDGPVEALRAELARVLAAGPKPV
jgi:ADP-heptose:LPS heptosyltransferase